MSLASIRPRQSGPNLIAIMFPHSLGPNHDAVIRIGRQSSGRWAHSLRRHLSHVMLRVHTISDRQSAVRLKPAASAEGKKMFLSLPEGLSACRAQDDALQ